MDKYNLKKMKWGDPDEKMIQRMKSHTSLIDTSFEQIDILEPPANDSEITRSEIAILADENMIKLFKSTAVSNGLSFNEKYFNDLLKQLSSLALSLKFKYNRPRPHQIAKHLGIEFQDLDLPTSRTPSYPSGHAFQSSVIANILSSIYPKFERVFKNLADRISLSRIQAGAHFPSDISSGIDAANLIEPYVRILYDSSEDRSEYDLRSITRDFLQHD